MTFVAIMAVTPNDRVAKYQSFPTEAEADAHVVDFVAKFPDAFVVSEPPLPRSHWLIDTVAKTVIIVPPPPPDFSAIDQITVDRLLLDSGVMRALATALFQVNNRVRVLEGDSAVTAAQFKTFLKSLIR